jgi:hypothetical protein
MRIPIWSIMGHGIACVKTDRYIMNLGIGKTLYHIGMIFNIKVHNKVDTLVYPYILGCAQHWFEPKYAQNMFLAPCVLWKLKSPKVRPKVHHMNFLLNIPMSKTPFTLN